MAIVTKGLLLLLLACSCAPAILGQQRRTAKEATEEDASLAPPPMISTYEGRPVYRLTEDEMKPPQVVLAPDPAPLKDFRAATIILWCVVGIDGKAHMIKVAKHDTLETDMKAVENLKQWKFKPGRKKNDEVDVLMKEEVVWH